MAKKTESKEYQKMFEEVQEIVESMSSSGLDLDEVVSKVERAYVLIKQMKDRLDETKEKVESIQAQFDEEID